MGLFVCVSSRPISVLSKIMNNHDPFPCQEPIVILIGPTAIGKTALSIELAKEFNFEIISVDSMQVYRFMDIGTAKISQEEMQGVPHHLIDVVNPDEPFDAALFEKEAIRIIGEINRRGNRVLLTGGTGLYLAALINGLSKKIPGFPEIKKELEEQLNIAGADVLHEQLASIDCISAKRIHKNDSHRLVRALEIYQGTGRKWSELIKEHTMEKSSRFQNVLQIGLTCEREKLYLRIKQRSNAMLENGFQEEVQWLLGEGYDPGLKSMQSIGYRHMVTHLIGGGGLEEMLDLLTRDTRRYAKRQYTWFNKIKDLRWLETGYHDQARYLVKDFIHNVSSLGK